MQIVSALVLVTAVASTASAQSAYVGASFIGDIIRVSGTPGGSGNGETFGGALRAGMPLGSQWGVELEFARTGEVDVTPGAYIAVQSFSFTSIGGTTIPSIFPPPQISSERRLSTISTLLWWDHELSDRVSLVYLGGVSFTRADLDFEVSYDFPIPLPGGIPVPLPLPRSAIRSETVSYGADVVVGFEGRVGMTEHLQLVPGIRLQTAAGGWSIRPGVGLQWMF